MPFLMPTASLMETLEHSITGYFTGPGKTTC